MAQTVTLIKGNALPFNEGPAIQNAIRVSRNELHTMLSKGCNTDLTAEFINKIENTIVQTALGRGYDVVIDDTTVPGDQEAYAQQTAENHQANFEVVEVQDDISN